MLEEPNKSLNNKKTNHNRLLLITVVELLYEINIKRERECCWLLNISAVVIRFSYEAVGIGRVPTINTAVQ